MGFFLLDKQHDVIQLRYELLKRFFFILLFHLTAGDGQFKNGGQVKNNMEKKEVGNEIKAIKNVKKFQEPITDMIF